MLPCLDVPQLAEGTHEGRSLFALTGEDDQCLQQRTHLARFLRELPPDSRRTTRQEGVLRWDHGQD